MINVSNDFKEAMKERRDFTSYAEITFRNGEKLTLDSSKFTTSNNSITDGAGVSSFPLGLAIQKNLQIEILNDEEQYRDYDFVGAKIRSYLDFKLDDGRTERIEKGTYTVVTPETYGETIIITAYDDMYKADKDYTTKLTFPQTAGSVLRDVCSTCDINLGSTSFLHDNFIIQEQPTGKFRDVIGYVAMVACGNARVDTRNLLQIMSYDFTTFDNAQFLNEWQSPKIEYNDNVITGFKTVIKGDTSENDTEVIVGTDAYMITVENSLITGKEETVLTWLFEKLANIPFRTFSGDLVSNPLIEFMDLVRVQDRRGNLYNSFITDVNFLLPGFTTVKNASPSMERYATSYSSSVAKTENNLRKLVETERTDRELAVERLNKTLSESSGMYSTEEIQTDGSTIYYLHDKPTISESKNVMKLTAEAIGFSVDGGKTYPFGFTIDGELIMRIIQTEGLNADWINAGAFTIRDDSGNIIFTADKDTKQVLISGDSVRIGGKSAPDALNDVLKESKDYSDGKLSDYANVVSSSVSNLQAQIDGQIETFYYDYEPTLNNIPASNWKTEQDREKHEGDLFYWKSKGYAYRFFKDGSTWKWQIVQDTDITQAMATAQNAQDTADGKRRVFVNTPQAPYDVGDLWTNGTDILTCAVARTQGSAYVSSDWQKLNTYTDDTVANEALEEARKSRNLNIILDNEYQGIPSDYKGNITAFPTVKTFVQVLYGHADVSVDCSYSVQKSSGVTGAWDNTTRTYTVTALTTDNGWVDITASYLSLFTTTKRFNVAKVKGGTPGEDGENGRGIKSTAVTYQASTSGTTVPTGTWQTSPPSVAANQYLWTRTIITYTDNTNSTSYSIGKMGANGTNGTDGKDGVGIGSVAEHYAVSTSNSTAPTSWSNSVPTMTATNKYLWNYETITYTNGTTSDTAKRVIGVYGDKGATGATGATGKGIKSVANYYLATASASGVTASTSGWTTTVQSVSASKKYLWNYEVVTFTDNTTSVTAPCVIGAYGDKGANGTNGTDGKDGVGVKTTAITYQASSSGTTIPNGTWSNSVPSTSAGQYLWTRTVITYTDNTTSTSYSVGRNGSNGTAARTYFIESSTLVLKRSADNSISPNFVEFKSFYRDGNNTSRIEYAGRFKIEETVDGITWTTLYTSSENESNITHSVYSVLSTANKEAIVTANGNMIGIPRDIIMIRCTLYASGGTTTALDMQSVTIVKDVDALTHEEIFNLLTNNGESKGIYKEGNQLYINATYLATGILTDLKKKNYWNLETGEFSLSSDVKNSVLDSQTQEQIYMKLTKNETLKGIFMQNGQLFVSFDYAKGGTLKLGGAGNINGLLSILNSSGTQIGKWDNSGVSINGGKIAIATNGKYGIMDSGGIRIATDQSGGDNLAQLTYSSSKLGGFLQLKSDGWGDTSIAGGYAVFRDVVTSNLTASGSKYRLVETKSYGKRLLNAYETPTPFFGDIGQGITNENGECIVFIDDVFLETINTKIEYQVFLQKEGQGDLWIDKKEYNYFLVKGTENLKFAWEIKAIQKGYESERLDEFDNNKEIGLEFDYEQEYINEIDNFIAEQEASYYEAIK